MSILSPDYDRLTNSDIGDATLTQQYKTTFASGDIDGAHTLVENANPNVAMSATRLNDLCDTITYMQNIWAEDKETFFSYFQNMAQVGGTYDAEVTYNKGDIVHYNDAPHLCIENGTTGVFDPSKWILLKPNDLGVNLRGEYDSQQTYQVNDVVWQYDTTNDAIIWKVCTSSPQTFETIVTKYPNIRYLGSNDTPYTNEIYMTDWNGGEA